MDGTLYIHIVHHDVASIHLEYCIHIYMLQKRTVNFIMHFIIFKFKLEMKLIHL